MTSYKKRTRPMVIAHGGNSCNAPMNTIIAIEQAIGLQVDLIEIDINLTADGTPVLFHGPALHHTTNGKGLITEITLKQAKRLDTGSWKGAEFAGETVPTLAEALEVGKGRTRFALDLKTDEVEAVVKNVQNADMVNEVVICGCNAHRAEKVRAYDKRLTVLLNMDSGLEQVINNGDEVEFINEYINQASSAHLAALNVNYKYVTEKFIWRAHLRALPVWTWTVDDSDEMCHLIELGVDAIYTNYPQRLISVLSS